MKGKKPTTNNLYADLMRYWDIVQEANNVYSSLRLKGFDSLNFFQFSKYLTS